MFNIKFLRLILIISTIYLIIYSIHLIDLKIAELLLNMYSPKHRILNNSDCTDAYYTFVVSHRTWLSLIYGSHDINSIEFVNQLQQAKNSLDNCLLFQPNEKEVNYIIDYIEFVNKEVSPHKKDIFDKLILILKTKYNIDF
mgnify:CR=1 FL=1